jgi:hypothetical protein
MSHSKFFSFKPDLSTGWLAAVYIFAVAFWCVLMAIAFFGKLNSTIALQWFLFAGLLVCGKGAVLSKSIFRGTLVLRQLRTPQSVGKEYLSAVLSHATLIWLITSVGGTLLLLACNFAWTSSGAIAIFSVLLSISTLTSLPSNHMWVGIWKGFLYVLLTLFIPWMAWKGFINPMDYLPQLPFWLLAALALSWPMTVYLLAKKWNTSATLSEESFVLYENSHLKRLSSYLQRFSFLAYSVQQNVFGKSTMSAKISSMIMMQYIGLMFLTNVTNARWNHGIDPYHFVGMLMVASMSCHLLVFKDMHWRILLAPGRLSRNSFSWHVFSISIVAQLLVYAIFACLFVPVAWLYFDVSIGQMLTYAWDYRAAPFQLLAANSLALLLLTLFVTRAPGLIFIAIACVLGGITFAMNGFSFKASVWFYVGSNYLISLIALTVFCVLLSNKLFTRQRILRYIRLQ